MQRQIGLALMTVAISLYGLTLQSAKAQTIKELEMQEQKLQQYDKALKALDNLNTLLEQRGKSFRLACLKAFGVPSFCNCVGESTPVAFSFPDYIAITGQSREQNQYSSMDKKTQEAYDKVGAIRDKCVNQLNLK